MSVEEALNGLYWEIDRWDCTGTNTLAQDDPDFQRLTADLILEVQAAMPCVLAGKNYGPSIYLPPSCWTQYPSGELILRGGVIDLCISCTARAELANRKEPVAEGS